ncbi:MAG: bifunctional molybdopterin-guanine dinucleotide biosynthesis adaptor protein MobB/molybdopterin molybdotransferase MoeA [Gammaproteobacteria bacterium]|nr:bifunctional molybdopterin-guanine dinucleotide biosynthesis adaptor protein MobB/molybdopterin molybdotransferase MoeA [Gammaproteobacteria bacterium]
MNRTVEISESCQDSSDSAISMDQALQRISDGIKPITEYRKVPLKESLNRIVAKPVISPINVPAYRNSAMDGYAVRGTDLPVKGEATLPVVGKILAGQPFQETLQTGQSVRIMTGAKMPDGADTVVIQEQVQRNGEQITLDERHKPGQNVRQAGEDIPAGSTVLDPGTLIGPAELGLLASLGIAEVSVLRPPRVAFFSSGDEIRSLGEPLEEGQLYDSNRYTLFGMLTQLGADVIDLGVIPDQQEAINHALETAAREADLILTSGGVSVGDADYIALAFEQLGQISFSKVAIKPGRPLTFGQIGNTCFFGLPGNPVAVMITFMQFVRPALKKMQGANDIHPHSYPAVCQTTLRKNPGRTEFQRGLIKQNNRGELEVYSTGRQGSGVLSSMSRGNCFILLPEEQGNVAPGDQVQVQPFELLAC